MSRCTCTPLVECSACIAARVAHSADINRGVGGLPPLYPSFGRDSEAYARNAARDERRKRRRDERLLGLTT